MQCDYVVIAASERTCPRGAWSNALQIFKHLSRERQEGFQRFLTLHAERAKNPNCCFLKGKDVAGRHDRCSMVERFARG
ncbi:MAG: hypothetical protein DMG34_04730 [Acidobacteria bacterium]|nr:MAG: hypothetical protein DMG34_04730 [Acidobacteriota bacterium]